MKAPSPLGMSDDYLSRFGSLISSTSEFDMRSDPTLGGQLTVAAAGRITINYAPFDYIERQAKIVVVGIAPGAQQASNALCEARRQLLAGADRNTVLKAAKVYASFSGPMRSNLVAMLDYVGLNRWAGIATTAELWGARADLVHFTSALRYPVFVGGKNYSGAPSMARTPILRELLIRCLGEEATAMQDAVWVPLGPKAEEGLSVLVQEKMLLGARVLSGVPHPSGANAERIAYFLGRKEPAALSTKTSAEAIDAARDRLLMQIAAL